MTGSAGLLALLVLLGAVAGCDSGGDLDSPRIGAVVRLGPTDDRPGASASVALPVGDLAMSLDTSIRRLPQRVVTRDRVGSLPAEGTSFVTVSWRLARPAGEPILTGPDWDDDPPELTVVGEDDDYDLGPMDLLGDPRAVAVKGSAAAVTLRLTYDDRTIAIDPVSGVVEPDPAIGTAAPVDCPAIPAESGDSGAVEFSGASCSLAFGETDWVPGLGWAAEGRRWTVVRIVADGEPALDVDGADVDLTVEEPRMRIGGAGPVVVLDRDQEPVTVTETPAEEAGTSIARLLVFDAAAGATDQRLVGTWSYRGDVRRPASAGTSGELRRGFDIDAVLPTP